MTIAFVTGGSGFVGRNLLEALRERGTSARALARSDEAVRVVESLGASAVRGDVNDVAAMTEGMRGCDVVFHAAAKVEEWGDPKEFHRVTVDGTDAVIAATRAAGVKKLVHVSTEAVLVGGGPIRNADESRPRPRKNVGLYPTTKAIAEEHVVAASSDSLTTVVVRPRFIWGAGDTAVLPKIAEAVRSGRFMWMSGGHYLTSTCHVRNVVDGMLLAAERGRGGEIYFLTDGEPIEFRTFVTSMLNAIGVDPGTKSVPAAVAHALAIVTTGVWEAFGVRSPPPLVHSSFHLIGEEVTVNDAKARRELGYASKVTRDVGLREMQSRS